MRLTFHWTGWACGALLCNYFINPTRNNHWAGKHPVLGRHLCQFGLGVFGIHVWRGWAPVRLEDAVSR